MMPAPRPIDPHGRTQAVDKYRLAAGRLRRRWRADFPISQPMYGFRRQGIGHRSDRAAEMKIINPWWIERGEATARRGCGRLK